jgi:hypothetical protein
MDCKPRRGTRAGGGGRIHASGRKYEQVSVFTSFFLVVEIQSNRIIIGKQDW